MRDNTERARRSITNPGGTNIAIRCDSVAGVIMAYLTPWPYTDKEEEERRGWIPVSVLSLIVVESEEGGAKGESQLYNEWVEMLRRWLQRVTAEALGIEAEEVSSVVSPVSKGHATERERGEEKAN